MAEDPAKRAPPGSTSYGGGGGMFRRYSPTTWAVAGVMVAGMVGYYMFYGRSKRQGVHEFDRAYPTGPPTTDRERNVGTK